MASPTDKNAGGPPASKGAASARPGQRQAVTVTWGRYLGERDGYELRPRNYANQTYR